MNIHCIQRYGLYGDKHPSNTEYTRLKALFHSVVKGRNFITPEEIGYVEIPGGVIEVSKGSKFLEIEMWGVTVVKNGKNSELSKCLHSWKDVKEYVSKLQNNESS